MAIKRFVPVLSWLPKYDFRANFLSDLISGVSFTALAIPEALAVGSLTGLGAIYGLYSLFVPVVVYGIFGPSRILSTGGITTTSIILNEFGMEISADLKNNILCITAITGTIQFLFYLLRVGNLNHLIKPSYVKGFINCITLFIVTSQLSSFTGVGFAKSNDWAFALLKNWSLYFNNLINHLHYPTLLLGLLSLALILLLNKIDSAYSHRSKGANEPLLGPRPNSSFKIPSILISLVASSLVVFFFDLNQRFGVEIIGSVEQGMPGILLPDLAVFDAVQYLKLIKYATILATLTFFITASVASTFDEELIAPTNNNATQKGNNDQQQLLALSLSNIVGSFFMAYVGCGSLTRTAVLKELNAKTQVALLVSVAVIMLNLLCLTKLYYFISKPTLAAIILSACAKLLVKNNLLIESFYTCNTTNKRNLLEWCVGFGLVFVLGMEVGIVCIVFVNVCISFYEKYSK